MKLTLEEEKLLIEKAKTDWDAFEKLYTTYVKEIYYYVLGRVGSKELAEDITSETFTKALDNIKKFQWKGFRFSSWLYKIATNCANEYYKKAKRTSNIDIDVIARFKDTKAKNAQEVLDQVYEKEKLMQAIKKLGAHDQSIILLRYFQDKSYEEIAEITGLQANNVGVKIHRILKKLKQYL